MLSQQASYRKILKATSIFGGVQVLQIIIRIVRSKFIAILIGPSGMGIVGLLNSTIELIGGLSNFGLGTSSIKDVSAANATGNETRVAIILTVLRRWVWITGTLGTIITIVLAKWLSRIVFGNTDYTSAFVWISMTLLLKQLTTGQLVKLQGLRRIQYLAKANLIGSILGLILIIPLYYFYGINAIVPAIITNVIISLILSSYYSNKVKIKAVRVSKIRTYSEGKNMLSMGFMVSISGLITLAASFIIRIFINNKNGIDEVGLYTAGFAIINTYVGLVFTAMATDYYPRLSEVANSNRLCKQTINQQAEIAILILGPILVVFTIFIRWIIFVLYTSDFLAIEGMIQWSALGMLFKAGGWSLGFLLLAKGASKVFFLNELIANMYFLTLNLLCYMLWGLTGLGVSFLVGYILYLFQIFCLAKIKYEFSFNITLIKIFIIQFLLVFGGIVTMKVVNQPYSHILGGILIITSLYFSYQELNKRINIKNLISTKLSQYRIKK